MSFQDDEPFREKLRTMRSRDSYVIEDTVERFAERLGINTLEITKLNANENFFIPREKLVGFVKEVADESDLRIYPQEETHRLVEKLSDYVDVPQDCIMIGNGSDELIERVMQVFVEKGDQALSISPTFSMYKHFVRLLGAEYVEVPLRKDFTLDTERILNSVTPRTKILILCSPNNPTGNQFEMTDIESLLEGFRGAVVVDEAYVEFADYSVTRLLREFDNLVVLRTFSKAFGLAGLRLGYGLANAELSTALTEKIQPPYPVSSMSLRMGAKLLDNIDLMKTTVEQLKAEREALTKELNKVSGVRAFNSQTNFVLFRTSRQLDEVYQKLVSRGVLVRIVGQVLHLDNCLRTTIGLPDMNERLINVLKASTTDEVGSE